MDFTDKVIIVTGSSSGIGAATAKAFAKYGALLTLVGRNEKRLLEVAKICTKDSPSGNKPICLLLDLTLENTCEELVRKTIDTRGNIHVLINCAGKIAMTSMFDDSFENFDELIALNLKVPYKMTQICVPHLKKTKGCVVNVFGSPMKVLPGLLVNSMIRDALERLTKSGALELASEGIRMNAVRPGITRTNLLTNLAVDAKDFDKAYKSVAQIMPNQVIIEPDEIARLILFAASDTCPNLIGSNLIIDSAASCS